MPKPKDRVQIIKQESVALGGSANDDEPFDSPIEPEEDALEAAGYYIQASGLRDESVLIYREGDDMVFEDITVGSGVTLNQLLLGGEGTSGLTSSQHRTLRQLIHFIDDGPAEGFTTAAYKETSGTVFPSNVTWYTSDTKTEKIVERQIAWAGVKVTTDKWKIYDTDGTTVLWTVSDNISYSGVFEYARTRNITTGDT